MPLNDLDFRAIPPTQSVGGHPVGMFDFTITNTCLKENKDKTGAGLVIEFTSPVGRIEKFYNVANPEPKAVEISNQQLSALGHAINIFRCEFPKNGDGTPNMAMAGHNMRGGKGRMEVAYQKGQEPTPEKPSGGYVEVKKVFDVNGNEPGKAPASAPMTQNPQGGWGNNQPQQQQPNPQQNVQPQQNSNWGGQPAQQQPQPQWGNQQPNNAGGVAPGPAWAK